MHARRTARALRIVLVLGLLLAAPVGGRAHVVLTRASLRQYLQHSPLTVRARILGDVRIRTVAGAGGADRQEVRRIRIERVWASRPPASAPAPEEGAELDVFFHAEGLPAYRVGDAALLFLEATAASPELAPLAAELPWYSVQGPGDEWILEGVDGERIEAQVAAWLQWLDAGGGDAEGLHRLLLAGLDSGVDRLEADAVSELVRLSARPGAWDHPGAVAAFAERVADPALPLSRRVALLRLLDRGLGPRSAVLWSGLVAGVSGEDEAVALARMAGPRPDPALAAWLRERARDASPRVRRAAWQAIAQAPRAGDLDGLATASADPDAAVARAAIRGLGALGGAEARSRLEQIARGPEPERARWAAAALRRRDAAGR